MYLKNFPFTCILACTQLCKYQSKMAIEVVVFISVYHFGNFQIASRSRYSIIGKLARVISNSIAVMTDFVSSNEQNFTVKVDNEYDR